jgi:hypothetical protein
LPAGDPAPGGDPVFRGHLPWPRDSGGFASTLTEINCTSAQVQIMTRGSDSLFSGTDRATWKSSLANDKGNKRCEVENEIASFRTWIGKLPQW